MLIFLLAISPPAKISKRANKFYFANMLHFAPDLLLQDIPNKYFKKLACALDRQESWKEIVKQLKIFDMSQMNSPLQTPGEKVLLDLGSKQCTIQNLYEILEICKLYDALSVICTERMEVRKQIDKNIQNSKMMIKRGKNFTLEFLVCGIPQPKYLWYKNDVILPEQTSSTLHYASYTSEMQGNYYSVAVQTLEDGTSDTIRSRTVAIETLPEPCVIIKKPFPEIFVRENEQILLEIKADGFPAPEYQWMHQNTVLQKFTGSSLRISKGSKKVEGIYRCRVSNSACEEIVQTSIKILETDFLFPVCKEPVAEKIALLIANEQYVNQSVLSTPVNDVNSLEPILVSMEFLVIKVQNLTLNGMRNAIQRFCDICTPDAYALVYFAGHGFELGEKYLLPVDAPDSASYGFKDSISEYQILRDVLSTKPRMFLLLLDMCLNLPDRSENSKIYEEKKENFEYKSERNLIQGYSTTSGLSAYEQDNAPNSLYNKYLKKYIGEKLPVVKILAKINQEIEKVCKNVGSLEQMPNISFNTTQHYYLNAKKKGSAKSQAEFAQLKQDMNFFMH